MEPCFYWTEFLQVARLSWMRRRIISASTRGEQQLIRSQTRCDNTTCIWEAAKLDFFGGTLAAGESSPSAAKFASSQVSTPFNHGPKAGPKTLRCGMLTGLVPIIIGSLYQ